MCVRVCATDLLILVSHLYHDAEPSNDTSAEPAEKWKGAAQKFNAVRKIGVRGLCDLLGGQLSSVVGSLMHKVKQKCMSWCCLMGSVPEGTCVCECLLTFI